MFLRIEQVPIKYFVGMNLDMSTAHDRTPDLWKYFMPNRFKIENAVGENVYSIQQFSQLPDFNIAVSEELYTNWAVRQVTRPGLIPEGMKSCALEGLYAVFLHKGRPADFPATAAYIFRHWLPVSEYKVENRPFFQVLTPAYNPADPASEEEVYIPIALKG